MHDKLLITTHLPNLLAKYKLSKFLCFRAIVYPRLVKMFYANLGLLDNKISWHVMCKHLIIDAKSLATEFEMNASPSKLTTRSFLDYRKEMAIDILFPYQTLRNSSRKTLITSLSPKDRILHFVIYKVLFLKLQTLLKSLIMSFSICG